MSLSTVSPEMFAAQSRINVAIAVAGQHGFAMPPAYATFRAVAAEANKIALAAKANPTPPPTNAADVAAWVATTAAEAAAAPHVIAAAKLAADAATRRSLQAAVEAVPQWIAEVCDKFPAAAEELVRLLASAPRTVTARTTPAEAKAHTELLAAVEQITSLALARGVLAMAVGEGDQIGNEGVWLVLSPNDSASLQAVAALVREVGAGTPTTLEQWARVAELGIGMARQGQVAARIERFGELRNASGMSAHGGQRDETYASANRLRGHTVNLSDRPVALTV
jgi:hypothetical protein